MTDLPQGWREVALGDLFELAGGFAYKSSSWKSEGVPVIKIGNVRNGKVSLEGCSFVSEADSQEPSRYGAKYGDLLMTLTGEIGAVGVYREKTEARVNQRVARVDVKTANVARQELVVLLLSSPDIKERLETKAKGVAQANISPKDILALRTNLPPLAEQERIVEILEEQFSRLDSALASVKAVREKAKAFRRSLLHSAFSGELTGGTEGWRETTLKDAAEVVMGQSPPSSAYNEVGVGKPFFQGKAEFGDKHPTVKKWTTEGSKHAIAGDILMSVRAPVGPTNIANVDCVIGRGLAAIRAGSLTNQTYLLWVLRSIETDIAAKGVGTTFASISGGELRSTRLHLPPLTTQERIVSLLEEQFSRLDKALEVANQLEARIASERRSLLHSAFTGALTATWRQNND
jgi:type I restriction enzyme S subunit